MTALGPRAAEARLAAGGADLAAAQDLRREVFVGEQGVPPDIEIDGRDPTADHAVVLDDRGRALATARLLDPGGDEPAVGVIGRVAVRANLRGGGYGLAVMRVLEARAADRGMVAVELHAQVAVVGFYLRQGYVAEGEEFLEAGIGHRTMRKELLPGLRPVADTDSAALIRLIGGIWAEYPGVVLDVDAEEPWLREPATAYASGGAFWVVPGGDGSLLASVGWRPHGPGTVELKSLYVHPSARRGGWGRRLVRRVERSARAAGAERVELWSDVKFGDAHRLYSRLGYARAGGERELHDLSGTVEWQFVRPL